MLTPEGDADVTLAPNIEIPFQQFGMQWKGNWWYEHAKLNDDDINKGGDDVSYKHWTSLSAIQDFDEKGNEDINTLNDDDRNTGGDAEVTLVPNTEAFLFSNSGFWSKGKWWYKHVIINVSRTFSVSWSVLDEFSLQSPSCVRCVTVHSCR